MRRCTPFSDYRRPMMTTLAVGVILIWLILAVGLWLGTQLLRQNGRILLRLDALEAQFKQFSTLARAAAPSEFERPSLPLGSAAPDFALPDLSGERISLSRYRGRR